MKINKYTKLLLLTICMFFMFSIDSYAGYQRWNSLDYDVTVNEDGSMDVIETWNVDISSTNTMFKTFEDSYSDDYEITNVRVSRIDEGRELFLTEVYEQQYHVTSGCFYGLRINSEEFEIAWNVGLDNSSDTRCYKMYYTVKDVIKKYDDCSELYWQFLSDNNGMPGSNVTGRVRLPNKVSNMDALRVWGHGNYSAEIYKEGPDLVVFSCPEVYSNEMLEIRIVTEDENMYPLSTNHYAMKKIDSILKEEQRWADEANREREEAKNELKRMFVIACGAILLNIIILIAFIKKSIQYKEIREGLIREFGGENDVFEMEYFRDIPDEKNATPGKAVYLREFRKNSAYLSDDLSNIFSATILNLSLKKILYFEAVSEKEVRIFISEDAAQYEQDLQEEEQVILKLLRRAFRNREYITIKDFNRFAEREYDYFYDQMHKIEGCVERELLASGKISREKKGKLKGWSTKQVGFLIGAFCLFCTGIGFILPSVPIGLIILGISARKNAICVSVLSREGQEESYMWNGLKKFMEDYSMLDERLVPDIVLWEKYLVYATAFGVADKVLKQLKVVHPEMFDRRDDYYGRNRYGYWYMVNSPHYHDNFFNSFNRDLGNVYKKAASSYSVAHSSSSSGSGGGGGFSGGGGGGGGGGSCGGR